MFRASRWSSAFVPTQRGKAGETAETYLGSWRLTHGGFDGIATQGHAAADPGFPTTSRRARRANANGLAAAAAGGVGRPAGQHAESRAALVARAGRPGRVVDVGGSVARPALGPSLPHLCRREARLRAVFAGEASRQRQEPASGGA